MKKILSLVAMAIMMAATSANAQSVAQAKDLAKQNATLMDISTKILNSKITKDAKKQVKEYKKEKWLVPVGEPSIERQLNNSLLYGAELMASESGMPTKRFICHTGRATSGSYNAAVAAARTSAQSEIAAMMGTQLISAFEQKLDNQQTSATNALTVDKYHERIKGIVDQSLTNTIPLVTVYRQLPNGNYEVQVRIAFDKIELINRLKRESLRQLEKEGDQLEGLVEDVICTKM